MAYRKGNHLSGLVGPVVVYELNGKEVVRTKPRKYKKTKGTLAAKDRFGYAATMGSHLREELQDLLPDYKLPSMRYRLENALRQWLHANSGQSNGFSFLDHFQFNEKALMPEKLKLPLSIDWKKTGKIIVQLPALIPMQHIAAPAHTDSIEWVFYAFTCNASQHTIRLQSYTSVNLKYDEKEMAAKQIELLCKAKKNELKMVVAGLKYTVMNEGEMMATEDERWRPVSVVGSEYE